MNTDIKQNPAERILEAIIALKEKSEKPEKKSGDKPEVDLVAITKKLSRNRERVKRANAKNAS